MNQGYPFTQRPQADLLRYFEEELAPDHQVIYTTHSPFMIDPWHFDRVRIVQDLRTEPNSKNLPADKQGTKVIAEFLKQHQIAFFRFKVPSATKFIRLFSLDLTLLWSRERRTFNTSKLCRDSYSRKVNQV